MTPILSDLQRKWLSAVTGVPVDQISFDVVLAFGQTRPQSSERVAMFVAKLRDVPPIHRISIIAWQSAGMAIHPFPPF